MDLTHTNNWDTTSDQYWDKEKQEWKEDLSEYLRFREWADRVIPGYYTEGSDINRKGMSYEKIITIANTARKNIWINIPHNASDDYVLQMAKLFKEKLDPNLVIYIEYSNEIWNWGFQQAQWILKHFENGKFPAAENVYQAAALRAKQLYMIWMNVYNDSDDKVVRVLPAHTAHRYKAEQWIEIMNDNDWDVLAITHYFGVDNPWGVTDPQHLFRDRLEALGSNATIESLVALNREWYNYIKNNAGEDGWWKGHANLAKAHNKPIITYEGGTHMVAGNNIDNPVLLAKMIEASRSLQMAEVYNEVLDDMESWGVSLVMPFILSSKPSKWGDWGHYTSIFETNIPPKVQVLLDHISPCQYAEQKEQEEQLEELVFEKEVFPNPFKASVTIPFNKEEIGKNKHIVIIATSGQIIKTIEATVQESSTIVLDQLQFSPGVYFLVIDNTKRFKIIRR